jgi:hypothetical protein
MLPSRADLPWRQEGPCLQVGRSNEVQQTGSADGITQFDRKLQVSRIHSGGETLLWTVGLRFGGKRV